jgi:hypothetical protein
MKYDPIKSKKLIDDVRAMLDSGDISDMYLHAEGLIDHLEAAMNELSNIIPAFYELQDRGNRIVQETWKHRAWDITPLMELLKKQLEDALNYNNYERLRVEYERLRSELRKAEYQVSIERSEGWRRTHEIMFKWPNVFNAAKALHDAWQDTSGSITSVDAIQDACRALVKAMGEALEQVKTNEPT